MKKLQKQGFVLFIFIIVFLFYGNKNDNTIIINLDEIVIAATEKFDEIEILDNDKEIVRFQSISDIVLGADSDILIMDRQQPHIVQLDKNLQFKKYIMVQAPSIGEDNSFLSGVYHNNNYYVIDDEGMRLQKYDRDMNYITSHAALFSAPYSIDFVSENEILSMYPENPMCYVNFDLSNNAITIDDEYEYLFCIRDTLGKIIRSFGNIEGNEEGVVEKGTTKRAPLLPPLYDPIYKHIFLVSNSAPIIRRFDLDGNLLQRINIEGEIIDTLRAQEQQPLQGIVKFMDKEGNWVDVDPSRLRRHTFYLTSASLGDGHKLTICIQNLDGVLELHYDDKNIIDKKIIKYENETNDIMLRPYSIIKDYNNIKLLCGGFSGKMFVNK